MRQNPGCRTPSQHSLSPPPHPHLIWTCHGNQPSFSSEKQRLPSGYLATPKNRARTGEGGARRCPPLGVLTCRNGIAHIKMCPQTTLGRATPGGTCAGEAQAGLSELLGLDAGLAGWGLCPRSRHRASLCAVLASVDGMDSGPTDALASSARGNPKTKAHGGGGAVSVCPGGHLN